MVWNVAADEVTTTLSVNPVQLIGYSIMRVHVTVVPHGGPLTGLQYTLSDCKERPFFRFFIATRP